MRVVVVSMWSVIVLGVLRGVQKVFGIVYQREGGGVFFIFGLGGICSVVRLVVQGFGEGLGIFLEVVGSGQQLEFSRVVYCSWGRNFRWVGY